MNKYTFDALYIGMVETFSEKITEERHNAFTKLSGDVNPMHMDEEFAKANGYEGRLVYGMLEGALLSTLVGVYLPGYYCLFQSVDALYFKRPVYIGDTVNITGKIIDKNESQRNISIKADIRNQNGEKVAMAKLTVGVMK